MLLARCADWFGEDFVKQSLQKEQRVCTLFSGVECARMSAKAISQAARNLWGIETGYRFVCAVSKPVVWTNVLRGPSKSFIYGIIRYIIVLGSGLRSRFPSFVLSHPKVEKDVQCQKLLTQEFPDECLFTDLFDLMVGGDQIDNTALLDPKGIKFRSSAQCKSHGKKCPLPAFKDLLTILGAPCVLFSRRSSCLYSKFY